MTIGEAARAANITPRMIRYYERLRLVPGAHRSLGRFRLYDQTDVHTLRFIGHARAAGIPLDGIRDLVALWQPGATPTADAPRIALGHATELRARSTALLTLADALQRLADQCSADSAPTCPTLDKLSLDPYPT